MPANAPAPMPVLPEVTVSLSEMVPSRCRHYFNGGADRAAYRSRRYEFGSSTQYMPLVRAFLDTCAAGQDRDYRYLFTLLGSELANNALEHSKSGEPFGVYTLRCDRTRDGLRLTCRDQGSKNETRRADIHRRVHLKADPNGLDLDAESGRGLAMIDALATSWGDNGIPDYRQVWFFLAYSLRDSAWNTQP
ncbi:ATP-binding protein [Nocardiopsis algeriensis]|uniref:Anti-sigma regulatory factor (Ser/Thr protein kinase) n=1 Tax=Nocardiopsis algeriensis TaxID=1478215 RepID=A0A841J170_9ACTN|nr:ATP-binding protein [Nocardiopsis algeriensis]MBB6122268.1 anti-sigma regulatory factor (Ser/Thr protein kinase) [Nocardiopsis algeriensis]